MNHLPSVAVPPPGESFLTSAEVHTFFYHSTGAIPVGYPNPTKRVAIPEAVQNTLTAFEPHILSPSKIRELQLDCQRRIELIQGLEDERTTKQSDIELDARIEYERADLNIRYYRLFRINDLPLEILTNIFRFYIWAVASPNQGVLVRLYTTWVCRHWRFVAISDTTLWSAVWFRDHPLYERSWTWADRAGETMLDIRINDSEKEPLSDADMDAFMDRLIPKLPHVRMLIILLQNWEPVLTVLKRLSEASLVTAPGGLTRFELHRLAQPFHWPGEFFQPVGHTRYIYPAFGGVEMPSLRYFSVNGVNFDWDQSKLKNLTTIDLRRVPIQLSPKVHRFRQLLIDSPQLEKLSFDGAGPCVQPTYQNSNGTIELKHLHTLVVANFTHQYAFQVFSHISAPNLLDMTLMNFFGDYTPLYLKLAGRFPTIRLMTLYGVTVHNSAAGVRAFVRFIDSMPLLTYLRIASVGSDLLRTFLYDADTFQFHKSLTGELADFYCFEASALQGRLPLHKDNPRLMAPKLVTMEIEAMDSDAMRRFLTSRALSGYPMGKVYVAGPMPNLTRQKLQELAQLVPFMTMAPGAKTPEEAELLPFLKDLQ
ncbi:hypothetical protein C8J56DRAFT_894201 [Mycena floridula]|nr:hypothetical protein C8J56DRAFT_894201 [Mycena floridula]